MGKLQEALDELHSSLPLIADQTTRAEAARRFTSAFYSLYLAQTGGLTPAKQAAVERFLTGSAHILEPALPFLDYNLSDRIEARLNAGAQADDWPIICQLRSTLEGLKELYDVHLPIADLIPDDPELDQALRDHATGAVAVAAPESIPKTHWWWALAAE